MYLSLAADAGEGQFYDKSRLIIRLLSLDAFRRSIRFFVHLFFFFNQETEKNPRSNASIENYIIAEIKERIKGREEV